ncbi:hypothetical protein V8B97DRAFT_1923895 [Scleroderma yunnanense]
MALQPRIPLRDLPIEQFVAPASDTRKHKRALSPSKSALYNPAKRRILDEEGISDSGYRSHSSRPASSSLYGAQFAAPLCPSRRDMSISPHIPSSSGAGAIHFTKSVLNTRMAHPNPGLSATTRLASLPLPQLWDPYSSDVPLPSCSQQFSIDRQSKHYPGFDIYHDHRIASPATTESLSDDGGGVEDDKHEGEDYKENVPPKRKTKKISHKSRLSLSSIPSPRLPGSPRKGDTACSGHTACFPAPR